MKPVFSLAICTFNRPKLLIECVNSIIGQIIPNDIFEILIVINNSSFFVRNFIIDTFKEYNDIRIFYESNQGLSFARNRACREADGQWIVYIDDDARLKEGYINRLNWIIKKYDFDCFGGMYYAWHLDKKPKWLPEAFGTKSPLRDDIGPINGSTGFLSGGNFIIKNRALRDIGGFRTDLGMSGQRIGYGEEDELQSRLLQQGYTIGFDPELAIDHLVMPHKYNLSWHLKSEFQQGVSRIYISPGSNNFTGAFLRLIFSIFGLLIKRIPLSVVQLITKKNYYFQNMVLDCMSPFYVYAGEMSAQFRHQISKR